MGTAVQQKILAIKFSNCARDKVLPYTIWDLISFTLFFKVKDNVPGLCQGLLR